MGDTIMQERYRMFCRAGGNFYARDKITGQSESLGTADRTVARQLLAARNQAVAQPQLNRTMAKAYLSAKSRSAHAHLGGRDGALLGVRCPINAGPQGGGFPQPSLRPVARDH